MNILQVFRHKLVNPLAIASCLLALAACSSVELARLPPESRPAQFVHIGEITVETPAGDADELEKNKELVTFIKAELVKMLKEEDFVIVASNEPRPRQVTIEGKMTVDYGNRALRMLVGIFGAGKGTAEFALTARDASGQVVASQHQDSSTRMGWFGGNVTPAAKELGQNTANDLVEQLLDYGGITRKK